MPSPYYLTSVAKLIYIIGANLALSQRVKMAFSFCCGKSVSDGEEKKRGLTDVVFFIPSIESSYVAVMLRKKILIFYMAL